MEPFDEGKNLLYYKIESNIKHWATLDRIYAMHARRGLQETGI